MSDPAVNGVGNERRDDGNSRNQRSGHREGDGDRHQREDDGRDSRERQTHSRREERAGGDVDKRSSRSHHSKRTRDGDKSDDKDNDRRERKHDKPHKHKKHKHRHDESQHTNELDQRIQHTKQQLALLSSSPSSLPATLTADDYYERSAEFRLWLHNSRSVHLDELDGEKARKLFDDFCTEWNSHRLGVSYYKGVNSSALSGSVLTGHRWGFVGAMSEDDKMANASVRDTVDTATHHHTYQQEFTATPASTTATPTAASTIAARSTASAPSSRSFAGMSKGEKKQHFRTVEAVMDEIAPRETGREAQLLKRREKSEYSRRERGGDGMDEVDDDVLLGGAGGESELARLKARENQRRDKRNEEQVEKRREWDRKEKERMRAMLQSIGQADKYNI